MSTESAKLTLETIIEVVSRERDEETKMNNLFLIVRGVLEKWEGKKLNKCLRKQIAEMLPPSVVVFYGPFHGCDMIKIWGAELGISYDNAFGVYLRDTIFNLEAFDKANTCVGVVAIERNNERSVDLTALGKLQRAAFAVDALKKARAEFEYAMESVTDRYAIERAVGLRK